MKKLNLNVIIPVIIVVAGILIAASMFTEKDVKTISSSGNAEISVDPDEVVVYLSIETRSDSADEAKDENAKISADVMSALEDAGVDKEDIETQNFNIYPDYDWSNGKRTMKGYVASNDIMITTGDFDEVGNIIDAAVDNGALVNYINFQLSNKKTNEYKAQVLAEASQDARNKAEATASGLGKTIGDIVSVSSSDYNYRPYPFYSMDATEAGSADVKQVATEINPQQLDVYASVYVEFELK